MLACQESGSLCSTRFDAIIIAINALSSDTKVVHLINMLAIVKSTDRASSNVDILPCRINHTGPGKITKRHWQPQVGADGTKTAYFRGRRLRGRVIKIPSKYHAVILKPSDKVIVDIPPLLEDEDEEPEIPEPVKVVDEIATVGELTIWGHDRLPATDDLLVKGVEEWIALSEAIHGKS